MRTAERAEWSDVPDDRLTAWWSAFQSSQEGIDIGVPCPVCDVPALHRWYQVGPPEEIISRGLRYVARGGLWEWCSNCRSFLHYSALVPPWWHSDLVVNADELTAEPEAIERARLARTCGNAT